MQKNWRAFRLGNVGLELAISFFVGFFGGRYLDQRYFGGHGWGTAIGSIVGFYAGFRSLYKAIKTLERETEADEARERAEAERNAKIDAYKRDADEPPKSDED